MAGGKILRPKAVTSADQDSKKFSRREVFANCATLGVAGTLLQGLSGATDQPAELSEEMLMSASGLSGQILTQKRVRAMRSLLEFNLKHIEVLREFDPDEEDPITMFRL